MTDFYGGSATGRGGRSAAGSGGRSAALETEDFQEEDIWATINAREIYSNPKTGKKNSPGSSSSSTRPFTAAAARPIPRATACGGATRESSAPVNIPDKWSKMLKKKSSKNLWDDGYGRRSHINDDDDEDMVPPHEYLARRLASAQIASYSMCEGVGRTLKGRDVTKFRNDILSKTGFLE